MDNCSKFSLQDEMIINNELYMSSECIASKFNEYFANTASKFGDNERETLKTDTSHLENFIRNKTPDNEHFKVPKHCPSPGINNNQHRRFIYSRWTRLP